MKIALLYEHPTWSNQLIQCFRKNGIELKLLNIDELIFDTGQLDMDFDLLINRVNVMPTEQRDSAVVFHTLSVVLCDKTENDRRPVQLLRCRWLPYCGRTS